jgi:hypothetical protein
MRNIQDIKINEISQIYTGLNKACRCGCNGTYISTTFHAFPTAAITIDNNKAQINLNKAKELALLNTENVEYSKTFINVAYGNNQAITIYLDDIKKQNGIKKNF